MEENIVDVLEHIPFQLDSDDNFADHEDNDEEFEWEPTSDEGDRSSGMGSVIPVCDTSFNQQGGYVSHGEGITTEALDLEPWQFENYK